MNRQITEIKEYSFYIVCDKGKYNYVADQVSRPVATIKPINESAYLGKIKELRQLQMGEDKWRVMIE